MAPKTINMRHVKANTKPEAKPKAKPKARPKARPKALPHGSLKALPHGSLRNAMKFELRLLHGNRWKLIKVFMNETCQGFLEIWAEDQGFTLEAFPGHVLKTVPSEDVVPPEAVLSKVLQPRTCVFVQFSGVPHGQWLAIGRALSIRLMWWDA